MDTRLYGECRFCHRTVPLHARTQKVMRHMNNYAGEKCEGSGRPPVHRLPVREVGND